MRASIYSLEGGKVGTLELPSQFREEYRPDLIKRAVLAIQTHRLIAYGADLLAGLRKVAIVSKRRRRYKSTYGRGIARVPKKTMMRRGMWFLWRGAVAPGMVGGRRAFPPRVEKVIWEKINLKERKKAIRSAIAATGIREIVKQRGHRLPKIELPIVLEDKFEDLERTKDVVEVLKKIGLEEELRRAKEKKIRPGRGKLRGRKYRRKVGPLVIVSRRCNLMKAARNIAGIDVVQVKDLNAELLAPGAHPGRLTLWTKAAIEKLKKEKFFT
jgi:large subunit ribosomal protein L4e